MPVKNLVTSLKRRQSPMHAHDRLPPELRAWLHQASLPWSAASALRIWRQALRQTSGDAAAARARLDAAEARLLARDAARIWGPGHPAAAEARAAR
jgi:hypothetical protein